MGQCDALHAYRPRLGRRRRLSDGTRAGGDRTRPTARPRYGTGKADRFRRAAGRARPACVRPSRRQRGREVADGNLAAGICASAAKRRSAGIHPLASRTSHAHLCRAIAAGDAMRSLILIAILLGLVAPAAAQTVDRLYIMDCGHNSAKDQALWSPGVNVAKPIEMSDTCVLVKHREQWLLWDTGYPDAVADRPVDTPVGHATREKKLITQLGELNLKPSDMAFVAVSHTHADHVGNVALFPPRHC